MLSGSHVACGSSICFCFVVRSDSDLSVELESAVLFDLILPLRAWGSPSLGWMDAFHSCLDRFAVRGSHVLGLFAYDRPCAA